MESTNWKDNLKQVFAWKERYKAAHASWFTRTYPVTFADHGCPLIKYPKITASNGLTLAICNFLKWNNHYANRINVAGRLLDKITTTESGAKFKDKSWIKSGTKKGTADIHSILNGKHISIEVKNKHTHDKMRPAQVLEQERVEKSGGVYLIADCFESFIDWYDVFTNDMQKAI